MEDNPDLNAFRRQWREEVTRRSKTGSTSKQSHPLPTQNSASEHISHLDHLPPTKHEAAQRKDHDDEDVGRNYDEFVQRTESLTIKADEDTFQRLPQKEPRSALEHFEKAVEKEAEGSLGDSLAHYRQAYRMDAAIDQKYRKKHFSANWAPAPAPASAPATQSAEITKEKTDEPEILPTPELIQTFASLSIPPAEPIIEGDPPPPCPIADVPNDVLIEILKHIALMDPASLCRMALVCKRFAYYFAHEQHIWKRLCQGQEFGFESMHYSFNCDIDGSEYHSFNPRYTPFPRGSPVSIPESLTSWSHVFQTFPRIRFTGIYISTVNYTRPGGASTYTSSTWTDPIHIVTYYRYLRFYPDGSVISLLTTTEPVDVVPHISKENVAAARQNSHRPHDKKKPEPVTQAASSVGGPVPTVAMQTLKYALRGRWHLARPVIDQSPDSESGDRLHSPLTTKNNEVMGSDPRDLVIETEGVDPKYTYVLHLGLRSSNPARAVGAKKAPPNTAKNTKLVWKGFWSYNKLTDDWGEFGLRNDRAFVFRRVRGWGL